MSATSKPRTPRSSRAIVLDSFRGDSQFHLPAEISEELELNQFPIPMLPLAAPAPPAEPPMSLTPEFKTRLLASRRSEGQAARKLHNVFRGKLDTTATRGESEGDWTVAIKWENEMWVASARQKGLATEKAAQMALDALYKRFLDVK